MTASIDQPTADNALGSMLVENTEKLLTCVHCGLCLPACPTYRVLGNENDSPRGRIYLMRQFVEGKLSLGETFVSHIDLCLGCRACESVCPSGVPYGHLLEAARAEVANVKIRQRSLHARLLALVLNTVFTRPLLLRALFATTRLFRDSGIPKLAMEAGLVSGRVKLALALLVASRSPFTGRSRHSSSPGEGRKTSVEPSSLTVALLRGCVMEGLFAEANRATERVLQLNGYRILEAPEQLCCGALHAHAGFLDRAKQLARKNIDAFMATKCDFVVVNSAGCGAAMKDYAELLQDDAEYSARANEFAWRVRDISELLSSRDLKQPDGRVTRRVVYDAPCHLFHAQRISRAPVDLMTRIPGLTLLPLAGAESCCGGAGIYNLQHYDLSSEILEQKIDNIASSGADTVATGNPGCIMQIGAGLLLRGLNIEAIHPIELLDAAYSEVRD